MSETALKDACQELELRLRLRHSPCALQLFESRDALAAIPSIRRPSHIHTFDQIVAQAARLGWTIGVTGDDLVGAQCRAVIGLEPDVSTWRRGEQMTGVWYATQADAAAHQEAMHRVPEGSVDAVALSPVSKERLPDPDIVMFYATPGAMMYFINGLQWSGYRRFDWSVVGESSCADSWGRALKLREPSLSIPCYAERRYGGVLDDEMLMATPPDFIAQALAGMRALDKNGLRYPVPQFGIQQDVRAGMAASYSPPASR
ncbi:MAG: DUF169 domain-containing protein [Burkholderiales bacterium]|nr:DUF169 domain-containing protein [Burkholderiales bacterium]